MFLPPPHPAQASSLASVSKSGFMGLILPPTSQGADARGRMQAKVGVPCYVSGEGAPLLESAASPWKGPGAWGTWPAALLSALTEFPADPLPLLIMFLLSC